MSTSLSSLADNLSKKIKSDKCRDCKPELNHMSFEYNQLIFQCISNYMDDFNKELIERFSNTYGFCNGDINMFILLLRKGVYPYEHMDSWEKFNETSLPKLKSFLQRIKFRRYY